MIKLIIYLGLGYLLYRAIRSLIFAKSPPPRTTGPQNVGQIDDPDQRKGQNGQEVEGGDFFLGVLEQAVGVADGREGVHADGHAQPEQDVRQRVTDAEEAQGQEGGKADQHAEQRVHKERTNGDQKCRGKVVRFFVHHVAGRITDAKETHIEYGDTTELAKEHVRGLVNDNARKGGSRYKLTWNDHSLILLLRDPPIGETPTEFFRLDDLA